MVDKTFHLGSRLHYPITITKLLRSPGDKIKKGEAIFEYKWEWRRAVDDDDKKFQKVKSYSDFGSPAEGVLKQWKPDIVEGAVIEENMACMTVEESCAHEVQIHGMCSICGQDMTEINWATEGTDTDRATVNMVHDQTGLMVSRDVAMKTEYEAQKRLLKRRKLSLVVDLDQTIIHACIDPTVGEWKNDPNNPNHDAVKDVKSFQLSDDGPRGLTSGCTYYIKLRPGLEEFLEEIGKMYELHVYTMGTRAYADQIANIVDPTGKLFAGRIISRDENGNIHAKSLQRIFPVSTNMVVIIDDRADVWPMNRSNLIKVVPYDFFKGIGDINSSFLPKRTDIPEQPNSNGTLAQPQKVEGANTTEAAKDAATKDIQRLNLDEQQTLKDQVQEQEKEMEKQLHDRPLQHMQEELDKEDEGREEEEVENGNASPGHQRQNLLNDDDEELIGLQDHLTDLHRDFYNTYDRRRHERFEGQPTHNPGDRPRRQSVDDGVDLSLVPDVGDILLDLKSNVLSGTIIVLSGLVPLGVKVEESDIGIQAGQFGAQVRDTITSRVTHLVVASNRPRTKKVQQAAKIPHIKIVNQNWLQDCISQWRRLDERAYYIQISPGDRDPDTEISDFDDAKDLAEIEDEIDDDDDIMEWLGMSDDDDLGSSKGDKEDGDSDSENDEDDDDASSETLSEDAKSNKGTKRQRAEDPDSDTESILAKKQRVARNRGASGLRSAVTTNGDGEGDSQPSGSQLTDQANDGGDEDEDEDDELERAMMAEFEGADMVEET